MTSLVEEKVKPPSWEQNRVMELKKLRQFTV